MDENPVSFLDAIASTHTPMGAIRRGEGYRIPSNTPQDNLKLPELKTTPDTSGMLNANRPIDNVLSSPVTAPASLSVLQSAPQISVAFDWKKYLPYLLALIAVMVLFMAMKKKGKASA